MNNHIIPVKSGRWFARCLMALAQRFARTSRRTRWRAAQTLGRAYLDGDPVFAELMHTNLRLCFPDWSPAQRLQLAQAPGPTAGVVQEQHVVARLGFWSSPDTPLVLRFVTFSQSS